VLRGPTRILLPLLAAALIGCTTTKVPFTDVSVPVPRLPFKWWQEDDLSKQPRDEAFRRLVQTLTWEYPYTEHKRINWQALEAEFLPRAEAAEAAKDDAAYYFVLRDFIERLRDANMNLTEIPEFLAQRYAGGYGLSLATLDDGRVFVRGLRPGGPAQLAGIDLMSEVVSWDGKPILQAVADAPMLWGGQPPATAESVSVQRHEGLVRAPIGSEAKLEFRPSGTLATRQASLTAVDEPWSALAKTTVRDTVTAETQSPVDYRVIEGDLGYVEVKFFSPSVTTPFPDRAFRNAMRHFNEQRVKGLIIDLRRNSGGLEDTAARMLGHFVTQPESFRTLSQYRPDTGQWEDVPSVALSIQTAEPLVHCPVVVLVHAQTSGSAETFAWGLRRFGRARIVGTSTTRGAAPGPEQEVTLPGGINLFYPTARWLGPEGEIRIESNGEGLGGVEPDVRIPMNETNFRSRHADGKDLSLGHAIQLLRE